MTVLVAEFARRHKLRPEYDADRNRLYLMGARGDVILYPGTTVAMVNGSRVKGMGRVRGGLGAWVFRPEDAVRVENALHSTKGRRAANATAGSGGSSLRAAEPEPGWRVSLGRGWRYIVIHHSATATGNAATFHRHHKEVRGWDGLGYHFVIGNGRGSGDGQVEVGYRWTRQLTGAHAGRAPDGTNLMNETGIGICLVGDFREKRPTERQKWSLRRLISFLRGYCGIQTSRVILHRDIKDTECPGRLFPASEFVADRREIPRREMLRR